MILSNRVRFALGAFLLAGITAPGQSVHGSNDEAAAIAFAQKAAVRALTFQEGDLASLVGAKDNFTASAWRDYMRHMQGFLDAKGAPEFSSQFEASGEPVVVRSAGGVLEVAIPGKLAQTHMKSRTVYRLVVTVEVTGEPPKIWRLEQTACTKNSTNPVCK